MDNKNQMHLLRHFLATLSYRVSKSLHHPPKSYSSFEAGHGVRSPIEILSHISDLMNYILAALTETEPKDFPLGAWDEEVERFYVSVELVDSVLELGTHGKTDIIERLLQGPFSDAMTHAGQLSLLRRLVDAPILGENFFKAKIQVGKLRYL